MWLSLRSSRFPTGRTRGNAWCTSRRRASAPSHAARGGGRTGARSTTCLRHLEQAERESDGRPAIVWLREDGDTRPAILMRADVLLPILARLVEWEAWQERTEREAPERERQRAAAEALQDWCDDVSHPAPVEAP